MEAANYIRLIPNSGWSKDKLTSPDVVKLATEMHPRKETADKHNSFHLHTLIDVLQNSCSECYCPVAIMKKFAQLMLHFHWLRSP